MNVRQVDKPSVTLNKFGFSQQPCPFSGSTWYKPLDRCFLAHVFIPALTNLSISWKLQNPNRLSALAAWVALQLLSWPRLPCLPQCFQPALAAEKGRKSSQRSEELAYVKPGRWTNYCWHYCWHTPDLWYIYISDSRVSVRVSQSHCLDCSRKLFVAEQ